MRLEASAVALFMLVSCGSKSKSLSFTERVTEPESPLSNPPASETSLTCFNFARELMARSCVSCHGAPSLSGAPSSFRLDVYEDRESTPRLKTFAQRVLARSEDGTMPPPSTGSLSDEELRKLREWVLADSPLGSTEPSPSPYPAPITELTYFNFATKILDRECTSYHGVPAAQGAPRSLRLDTYDDRDGIPGAYSLRDRIKARMDDGSMPPPEDGNVSPEDVSGMGEWVLAGAPKGEAWVNQLNPGGSFQMTVGQDI